VCKLDVELEHLWLAGSGWQWMDEGQHGNHKWGYVASNVGSWLELQLPTAFTSNSGVNSSLTSSANSSQVPHAIAHISVMFLKSYENMGTAKVTCVLGCTCDPMVIDGHWTNKASQPGLQDLQVRNLSECLLRIEVQATTKHVGGHKVKILGLVASSEAMLSHQAGAFGSIRNYVDSGARYSSGRRRRLRNLS
jgi:hypothetical protein